MALEIVGQLLFEGLVGLGTLGVRHGLSKLGEWRDLRHFESLDDEAKRAFVEVVVAAILEDGHQSETESSWLAARAEAGDALVLIAEAVEVVEEALPPGGPPEALDAFIATRVEALGDEDTRERVFDDATRILLAANGANAFEVAVRFGVALGREEGETRRRITVLQARDSLA